MTALELPDYCEQKNIRSVYGLSYRLGGETGDSL